MEIERRLQTHIIHLLHIVPEKFEIILELQMEQMGINDRRQALEALVVELLYRYEDPLLDYLWFSINREKSERAAA